jgi:hypothetical protein
MKMIKLLPVVLVAAFFSFTGTASAQKLSLNTSTAKNTVNASVVEITLKATELASASAANTLVGKLKTGNGIQNVKLENMSGQNADIVVTLPKSNHGATLQRALQVAGIETITVDGKLIKTSELVATVKAEKKK